MTASKNKIIVALDVPELSQAEKLITDLKGLIEFYKVGFEFFTSYGWEAVQLVEKVGGKVFLDLKLHDIPNTVAGAVSVLCRPSVTMFTVHTLGGMDMMMAARRAVDEACGKKCSAKPAILGVTILTSHSQETLSKELRIEQPLSEQVLHLARMAQKAGLDGVVASPLELTMLRSSLPKEFLLVTPGIRPEGSPAGDQKRALTPQEALEKGANYLVIGRPITASPNPRAAAESILKRLS